MKSPVDAWIDNSAKHHLATERDLAKRCRNAYRTEPMKGAANLLGEAHEKCAAIWQTVLDRAVKPNCPYRSHAADCDCNGMGGDR